jgi:hypothetical protein
MSIFSTLAEVLPKLKTKLQLSGFIVLIAAVVATRSIAPTALNAQISAGAIGILFIVFGQVFSSLRDIPETDRSRLILLMFSVFCLFVLALVVTTSVFIAKAGPASATTTDGTRPTITTTSEALPAGQTTLLDGFRYYGQSGFSFAKNAVVSWSSPEGDILVANPDPQKKAPAEFFLPNTTGVYEDKVPTGGKIETANAGIIQMPERNLDEVLVAPPLDYPKQYFKPEEGIVYCVRTRDGSHYAKIKITSIEDDRIAFAWVYQPSGSRALK